MNPEKDDLIKMRELLWLRHGCSSSALYSYDGEMRCNSCLIDFKRDSAESIEETFLRLNKRFVLEVKFNGTSNFDDDF